MSFDSEWFEQLGKITDDVMNSAPTTNGKAIQLHQLSATVGKDCFFTSKKLLNELGDKYGYKFDPSFKVHKPGYIYAFSKGGSSRQQWYVTFNAANTQLSYGIAFKFGHNDKGLDDFKSFQSKVKKNPHDLQKLLLSFNLCEINEVEIPATAMIEAVIDHKPKYNGLVFMGTKLSCTDIESIDGLSNPIHLAKRIADVFSKLRKSGYFLDR